MSQQAATHCTLLIFPILTKSLRVRAHLRRDSGTGDRDSGSDRMGASNLQVAGAPGPPTRMAGPGTSAYKETSRIKAVGRHGCRCSRA